MQFACRITKARIRTLIIFNIHFCQQYEVFCSSMKVQMNPLLQFHGNIEHFYIVYSYIYAKNNKNGKSCCAYGKNGYANALHDVTCYVILYIVFIILLFYIFSCICLVFIFLVFRRLRKIVKSVC
jgi:hypothetical protein